MRYFLITIVSVLHAAATPSNDKSDLKSLEQVVSVATYEVNSDHAGTYSFSIHGEDGSSASEQGSLKNIDAKEGPTVIKSGTFSYISPEGKTITTSYTADENGFHAVGDHIPTSPPEKIRKSPLTPLVVNADGPSEEYEKNHESKTVHTFGETIPSYAVLMEPYKIVSNHF